MHGSVAGLTRHDVGDRERELLVLIEEVVDVLVQRERADSLHWEEALRPNLRVVPFGRRTAIKFRHTACVRWIIHKHTSMRMRMSVSKR